MPIKKLSNAMEELKVIINDSNCTAYFFMVGSGISSPSIPTASAIVKDCIKKLHKNLSIIEIQKLKEHSDSLPVSEQYSFWLEKTYPSAELRRKYFEKLITKAKVSSANIQLANILSSKKITNTVITTNFDDHIEKSLLLLGYYDFFVSENKEDNIAIEIDNKKIQIIHLHGTYKIYNCKNLNYEISSKKDSNTDNEYEMDSLIQDFLRNKSPIVIGYSGWENDIFMTNLRKRLSSTIRFDYYWFCYSKGDYEKLPLWLKGNNQVNFILPDEIPEPILEIEFDFSIRDFEELLGLGRNVIYYIEKGTSDIDTEKVALFCKLFQVSSDYFKVLSDEGIYVKYLNNTYSLTRENFFKYKELGFIKYKNKQRLLVLPDGYDIDFVYGNIKLIEVKPKKN